MNKHKSIVFLPGASGSMGFETFKLLWEQRDRYDIVLLQRPSGSNKKLFRKYEKEAGVPRIHGNGVTQGNGLKIVWGDATNRKDVFEACRGIDWCLCCMALISPEADRHPEEACRVNTNAIRYIIEAIEEQDPEHIRLVYIGTIAEYGDRLPPVHVGRVGDPILPSIYDMYANSKIKGELAVMESGIRHWVSLRQTFIMIPDLFSLLDPIMFHQPINSFMETITAKDSGRVMIKCLEIPDDSDFWRNCYNVSGGHSCRITFLEFLERVYGMLGIDYRKAMDRNWFALKNFHMQFFEDAHILNDYLNHWEGGQTLEDYFIEVWNSLSLPMKFLAGINRHVPPVRRMVEKFTWLKLKKTTQKKDGTLRWIRLNDEGKIKAFYGSMEDFHNIAGWDEALPSLDHNMDYIRLDHGYDEQKANLDIHDLRKAARFRGGRLLSEQWDGNLNTSLTWSCCQNHTFRLTPYSVLKAGHWCVECVDPPWNYDYIAEHSDYFSQILAPRTL
ncbi:MAG: NAD(P)-dependent oxidoreductase [Bacteroidales bacterium]|nr:NAD(P)-dependent oxidoreductase [Bacteroidales bacterium]